MDRVNWAVYKEMKRVIKYVLDTKNYSLKMALSNKGKWQLEMFMNTNWAGNKNTYMFISGYLMFLNGCIINWRSRGQQNVTLLSRESKYIALSKAV